MWVYLISTPSLSLIGFKTTKWRSIIGQKKMETHTHTSTQTEKFIMIAFTLKTQARNIEQRQISSRENSCVQTSTNGYIISSS